MSKNDKQKAR